MSPTPLFKLTALNIALFSGFAYAADPATEVKEVEVKGERVSSTHRLTLKDLDETTATDMKEVLFNEPSVSFGGGNATSQWVTIRGMGQDQIDFKVDDTYSDTQLFHHNGRFLFDPELVKVVAVQKGTGSASAGIGATSGAIVAQTVDAADLLREGQNAGFKIGAGISSNKGWNRGAAVYGRSNGFDALLAGNWITERNYKPGKGYSNLEGGDKVNNSALGQRGLLGKISYNFNEDHRLTLSHRQEKTYGYRALREEFDFAQAYRTNRRTGEYVLDADGNRIINSENNTPRYRTLSQDTTNLAYEGAALGFIDKIKANVYRQNIKREEQSDDLASGKIVTLGANAGFDSRLFDRHTLKYGINWRHQESKPKESTTSNEEKTDVGAYVEGIWDISPVTLTTGLRYDHFDVKFSNGTSISDGNVNPSIGLIYDATPNLSFNTSLNYASRSPRLSEVLLTGDTSYGAVSGLKAERSRNAEIGFQYVWNSSLSLDGSYFNQKIKDIQAINDDDVYYNGGTLKNRGYELGANYRWRGLTARFGVAYNKPEVDGASIDSIVTAVPMGRTWTTGLAYQFDNPNLEIGWRGRFVQSSTYDITQTSTRGSVTTSTKRAGYGVNDIYANWKPTGKDNLNINFAVNNVGNKLYKPHSQRTSSFSDTDSALPEVGRDFRLAVNYRF